VFRDDEFGHMLVIGSAFSQLNFVRISASQGGPRWKNSRRSFLKDAGAAVIVTLGSERTPHDASRRAPYSFFTADEAAFIEPAVVHLIPADETGAGCLKPSRRLGRGPPTA